MSQLDSRSDSVRRFSARGASSTRPFIVASAASTRNSSAFDVVCKVKSKKLCTSTAKHPLNAASATPRRKSSRDLARDDRLVKQQHHETQRQNARRRSRRRKALADNRCAPVRAGTVRCANHTACRSRHNAPRPVPRYGCALIMSSVTDQKCARPVVGSSVFTLSIKRLIENSPPSNTTPINRPTSSAVAMPDAARRCASAGSIFVRRLSLCFLQIAVTITRNSISATRLMMPPREARHHERHAHQSRYEQVDEFSSLFRPRRRTATPTAARSSVPCNRQNGAG